MNNINGSLESSAKEENKLISIKLLTCNLDFLKVAVITNIASDRSYER